MVGNYLPEKAAQLEDGDSTKRLRAIYLHRHNAVVIR
jgi:hypothetical protein